MDGIRLIGPLAACAAGSVGALSLRANPLRRKVSATAAGWMLAAAPLVAFVLLLDMLPDVSGGTAIVWQHDWLPSLGLSFSLYFDSLTALFGLLVTGIGALVVVYAGYYFKGDPGVWRFFAYIFLFMAAMLGLILAGDLITLFVFWEITSVSSFLLIAYEYKQGAARDGAFKSFLVTAGGGVALLAGILLLADAAGSTAFQKILAGGTTLRDHPSYPWMLGLLLGGVFTKSAQIPTHFWLPRAMSAPTPASAYLHSATMVKAGIYLIARLHPVLGRTDLWFWCLSIVGLVTMLTGVFNALRENDLKGILAYSTVSQLGVLTMLIGQETEIAAKALVIGILAHGLYKSALFMVAGIVDHETGTRDLRRLGGLRRAMPVSFALGMAAAFSMGGFPPLFGFLAKETLLASVSHPAVPAVAGNLMTLGVVAAGAMTVALAGLIVAGTFLGRPGEGATQAHEAPAGMLLAPAIPAVLSLAFAALPEPKPFASFLADAAARSFGGSVKVSLALWAGIQPPLLWGIAAVSLGVLLFRFRVPVRAVLARAGSVTLDVVYDGFIAGIDTLARLATRTQHGRLRGYLVVLLIGMGILFFLLGPLPLSASLRSAAAGLTGSTAGPLPGLRLFVLLLSVAAAGATLVLREDLQAVLALGASSLAVAVLMVLEPAPDVALVQVVVDILATVILVFALVGLPGAERAAAPRHTYRQRWGGLLRDAIVAGGCGLVMAVFCFAALSSRPRETSTTPFYERNAKPLTGADDIVGAIVVDFRGFDTLVEITVFSMAGLAIYLLLKHASPGRQADAAESAVSPTETCLMGIGEGRTSVLLRLVADITLPFAAVLAATHVMYGHDQPGDGFTAGVILSLGTGLWYIVFGYEETRSRLRWLRPFPLIGAGFLLVLASASAPALAGGSFFAPMDFGRLLNLPLPKGFNLSTSFLFEAAICLTVLGSASAVLDVFGHRQAGSASSGPGGDAVHREDERSDS